MKLNNIWKMFFHTHRLGLGTDAANDMMMNTLGILSVVIIFLCYFKVGL